MTRVLFVCLLVCLLHPPARAQRISLIFRFDDYSGISDTELDAAIFDLFQKHSLPLTVGIVPYQVDPQVPEVMHAADAHGDPLSPEKSLLLFQAVESGLIEPALHGLTHADLAGAGRAPLGVRRPYPSPAAGTHHGSQADA